MRKKQIMAAALGSVLIMSLAGCSQNAAGAMEPSKAAIQRESTKGETAAEETKSGGVTSMNTAEEAAVSETQEGVLTVNGGIGIPLSSLEHRSDSETVPAVYFISDITPEALVNIYEALGWTPTGRVAVKISTGEPTVHRLRL